MKNILIASFAIIIFAGCIKTNISFPQTEPANETSLSKSAASIGIKGDTNDIATNTSAAFVLMGGGADVTAAIKWMLERSGGGDVVVIRATGTDAYDAYMYRLFPVNSVETLLINSRALANDATVAKTIRKAECLFIAGGNQSDYVNFWKGTLVNDAINYLINSKKVPVGGTSAGCMILGQICFDAENGSVTSDEVLQNPYNKYVSFTSHFISIPFLQNIITDTHYNNPDRRGRQFGFMARLFQDSSLPVKGIGLQEQTAVAIDENGNAKVFGFGKAFFMQANTALGLPELCKKGSPLTWNKNAQAVNAYIIDGSRTGNGNVNIPNWNNFSGGKTKTFSAVSGTLAVQ